MVSLRVVDADESANLSFSDCFLGKDFESARGGGFDIGENNEDFLTVKEFSRLESLEDLDKKLGLSL